MTHDPKEIEAMARLLCNQATYNWEEHRGDAVAFLNRLAFKGWKITERKEITPESSDIMDKGVWNRQHDAAPMIPVSE